MVARMDKTKKELRRERKEMRHQRRRNDPGRYLFIGLLLILAAVLYFSYEMRWINGNNWLAAFIIGLGVILIITTLSKGLNSLRRAHISIRLIGGGLVLCYGLALVLGLSNWWPMALAVVGVALIFTFFFLQREVRRRWIAQETLHDSEVKYGHIIDNANSIIMEVDPRGNITFVNKFARDFFGYKTEEIVGHNIIGTILPQMDSAGNQQQTMIENIAVHPENYLHIERENILRSGGKVWIIWTYKPIFDEDDNLKEILCIGIDRTEQKEAEDLAARQLQEKTVMEERASLARDLHDAVSQNLFSASLIADVLPLLWERDKEEGLKRLEEVRQLTRGSLAEMRTLLFELRPAALVDAELGDLLRQLAEAMNGRAKITLSIEIEGTCEIPVDVKIALYRISQEALNNMAKYSAATRGQVTLHCEPHEVMLHIIDNGRGFDTEQVASGGFGLGNMNERANQIGASLKLESKINEGTEITVVWHDHAGEMKK